MHVPWKIDSYFSGFLLVATANTIALVGLLASRRLLRRLDLISHHEVGGFLLSVVGTMYAVILGLIVVDSLAKFQFGRLTTEQESNALANIVLLSHQLPPDRRDRVQGLAIAYADLVKTAEWPLLDDGKFSPEAQSTALQLIDAVGDFEPKTGREQAVYEAALDSIEEFWNNRRIRVVTATHGVPGLEWFVLVAGGMITVIFTFFFRLDHLRIQVAMTSLVATIIALNLYLILMFGYPFSGDVKVSCDSFDVAQAIISHRAAAPSTAMAR
ncbi:MAG TPA: hypothetical protein VG406_07940 [Isosphaeraceae bacterium]|jgi:hypothetical protein|nr:hypothetical protein [Isosphaeraceae bacterium]